MQDTALESFRLFVVGAHLSGEPLNHQLTALNGRLSRAVRTAPCYRLFALPGMPARPGMIRAVASAGAIEGEIWMLPPDSFGRFVHAVPAPLTIGRIELESGESVSGFLCESYATAGCPEITAYGGWRRYRETLLQTLLASAAS